MGNASLDDATQLGSLFFSIFFSFLVPFFDLGLNRWRYSSGKDVFSYRGRNNVIARDSSQAKLHQLFILNSASF